MRLSGNWWIDKNYKQQYKCAQGEQELSSQNQYHKAIYNCELANQIKFFLPTDIPEPRNCRGDEANSIDGDNERHRWHDPAAVREGEGEEKRQAEGEAAIHQMAATLLL